MLTLTVKLEDSGMNLNFESMECMRNALSRLGRAASAGGEFLKDEMQDIAIEALNEKPISPTT